MDLDLTEWFCTECRFRVYVRLVLPWPPDAGEPARLCCVCARARGLPCLEATPGQTAALRRHLQGVPRRRPNGDRPPPSDDAAPG